MKLRVKANLKQASDLNFVLYSPSTEKYYTGKAGEGWLGSKDEAFHYSQEGGERQAKKFNEGGFAVRDWQVVERSRIKAANLDSQQNRVLRSFAEFEKTLNAAIHWTGQDVKRFEKSGPNYLEHAKNSKEELDRFQEISYYLKGIHDIMEKFKRDDNETMVARLRMRAATQPTPPSPELVAAIENRKQNPTDFEAFKQLFEAVRNDNEAVSGYDGVGTIMRRLGISNADIHALMSVGEQTTPEGKYVRDHWDEVNRQHTENKSQERLTKFGPELVDLCKQVYDYANQPENYENGWDTISEAWDLEELAEEIKGCKTLDEALDRVRPYVRMEG
jgi:hypothetical protein